MSEFTRGPWTATDDGLVRMPPTDDFRAPGVTVISPNEVADARLIAAAPDLYEALRQARRSHYICEDCFYSCSQAKDENGEWACCNNPGERCDCGADAVNAVIDAALAKADGRE